MQSKVVALFKYPELQFHTGNKTLDQDEKKQTQKQVCDR
jgi:hypothetical protein